MKTKKHRALINYLQDQNGKLRQLGEWLLLNVNSAICSSISRREQVNFQWNDDEVSFVLHQQAWLDFNSASLLKQKIIGKHVVPLGHNILIPI